MANVNQTTNRIAARPSVAPPSESSDASPLRDSSTIKQREEEGRGLVGGIADVFIGGGEAIGDMVKGIATAVMHPIDTISGLGTIFTHPGLIVSAFVEPYKKAIDDGRPGLAIGRGLVEVGSLFLGGGVSSGAAHGVMTGAEAVQGAGKAGSLGAKGAAISAGLTKQATASFARASALEAAGFAGEAAKINQFSRIMQKSAALAATGTDASVLKALRYTKMASEAQHVNFISQAGAKVTMSMADLAEHSNVLLNAAEVASHAGKVTKWATKLSVQADAIEARAVILGSTGGNHAAAIAHLNEYAKQLRIASGAGTERVATKIVEEASHVRGLKSALTAAEKASAGISDVAAEASRILNGAPAVEAAGLAKGAKAVQAEGLIADIGDDLGEAIARTGKEVGKDVADAGKKLGKGITKTSAKIGEEVAEASEKVEKIAHAIGDMPIREIPHLIGEVATYPFRVAYNAASDAAHVIGKGLAEIGEMPIKRIWEFPVRAVRNTLQGAADFIGRIPDMTLGELVTAPLHVGLRPTVVLSAMGRMGALKDMPSDDAAIVNKYGILSTPENVKAFKDEIASYQDGAAIGPDTGTPAQVKKIQGILKQLGYDVTPSGIFDEETAKAVVDFKEKHGLQQSYQLENEKFDVNPYVDEATAKAMLEALKKEAGPAGDLSNLPKVTEKDLEARLSTLGDAFDGVKSAKTAAEKLKAKASLESAAKATIHDLMAFVAANPKAKAEAQTQLEEIGKGLKEQGYADEQIQALINGAKAQLKAEMAAAAAKKPATAEVPDVSGTQVKTSLTAMDTALAAFKAAESEEDKVKTKADLEKAAKAAIHDVTAYGLKHPDAKANVEALLSSVAADLKEQGYTAEQLQALIAEAQKDLVKDKGGAAEVKPAAATPEPQVETKPAAGAADASQPEPKPYAVVRGDSLTKIAQQELGNANRWREIYELNKAVIGANPNLILAGQKLQIPGAAAVLSPAEAVKAAQAAQAAAPEISPALAELIKEKHLLNDAANIKALQDEMSAYEGEGALGPELGSAAQVTLLQRALGLLGYATVAESGQYDAATQEAVIDFKKKHGLHQTYKLDDGTFAINEYTSVDVAKVMIEQAKSKVPPASRVAPDGVSVA